MNAKQTLSKNMQTEKTPNIKLRLLELENEIIKAQRELSNVNMNILNATQALLNVKEAQIVASEKLIDVNHQIILKSASFMIEHAIRCATPVDEYYLN